MTGYFGYSKSNNAIEAEANGRFPKSKITNKKLKELGLYNTIAPLYKNPAKIIKAKIESGELKATEYHHTSKEYNITYYYDLRSIRDYLVGNSVLLERCTKCNELYDPIHVPKDLKEHNYCVECCKHKCKECGATEWICYEELHYVGCSRRI